METYNTQSQGPIFDSGELKTELFEKDSSLPSTVFKHGQSFLIRTTLQLKDDPALFITDKPPVLIMGIYWESIGPGEESGSTKEMPLEVGKKTYEIEITVSGLRVGVYKLIGVAHIRELQSAMYQDGPIIQIYYD